MKELIWGTPKSLDITAFHIGLGVQGWHQLKRVVAAHASYCLWDSGKKHVLHSFL